MLAAEVEEMPEREGAGTEFDTPESYMKTTRKGHMNYA